VATPKQIQELLKPALQMLSQKQVAIHLHDTRGTALANALKSLEMGVRTIDSSVGGLGGCPFAPGATGNLATEDLVYMLHGMGMKTGIDLEKLAQVSIEFFQKIKKPYVSHYSQAFIAQRMRVAK
jgi:hydroxymethylglutaryl-CoA lyase